MGREARRVPLDFDWPLRKTWEGYLLPSRLREGECPDCSNGYSAEGAWLQKVAYVLAGSADDAVEQERGRPLHPYLEALNEISYGSGVQRPGRRFGELVDGLAPDAGSRGPLGRDVYTVARALREAARLPDEWEICSTCDGHATREIYTGQRAEAEAWEPTEPPTGDGWQMWETTSEGSPTSPVFATAEALADYCADHVSVFGSNMAPREQWLRIITGQDFAHVQIAPGVVMM